MSFSKKVIFTFLIFFNGVINSESTLIQNVTIYDGKNMMHLLGMS